MLSFDLLVALVAAALWALVDVVRLGTSLPALASFTALLGSASLIVGALVMTARRVRPLGDGLRAVVAGASLASFPLAFVAATLERVTHHRALGGVTVAFVALVVVALTCALAWRVLRGARGDGKAARRVLAVASLASLAAVVLPLCRRLGEPSAASLVPGVVDAALGAAVTSLALFVASRAPRFSSRFVTAAWACAVVASVVIVVAEPSLCASLAERAPVAFALGTGCGD